MDDQHSEIQPPPTRPPADPDRSRTAPAPPPRRGGDRVQQPRRRWPLVLLWLLIALAIIGAAVWYIPRAGHHATKGNGRMTSFGPIPVGVAPVRKGEMPVTYSGLGTVTPLAVVTIKTQINGYLTQIGFKEGQLVKKGDFLAQIDPRPYQVALEQAEAQLGKDAALLKNAQLDLQRYDRLVAENSIARQTRDTQASLVAQYQAAIKADQAQIDAQKLNLTYCHIVSPVGGRVGLRQVDAGNYVQTSDANGIVVVTQTQPISVIFTLPEDDLPAILKQLHGGARLAATAYDRTGTVKLDQGTLATVDNQIDTTTGTVKLRADFPNPQEILFPNQFVNVTLLVDTLHNVELVPNAAILRGAPGTFVYVVEANRTVAVKKVKLGPGDTQNTTILSGLDPGEQVVVDGADRLKDGAKVSIAGAKPQPGASEPAAGHGRRGGASANSSAGQHRHRAGSAAGAKAESGVGK
jgi:membrane fusion protein, multidrug efflux system